MCAGAVPSTYPPLLRSRSQKRHTISALECLEATSLFTNTSKASFRAFWNKLLLRNSDTTSCPRKEGTQRTHSQEGVQVLGSGRGGPCSDVDLFLYCPATKSEWAPHLPTLSWAKPRESLMAMHHGLTR